MLRAKLPHSMKSRGVQSHRHCYKGRQVILAFQISVSTRQRRYDLIMLHQARLIVESWPEGVRCAVCGILRNELSRPLSPVGASYQLCCQLSIGCMRYWWRSCRKDKRLVAYTSSRNSGEKGELSSVGAGQHSGAREVSIISLFHGCAITGKGCPFLAGYDPPQLLQLPLDLLCDTATQCIGLPDG